MPPVDSVHDWNPHMLQPARVVEVQDETLRDGLQSASVRLPDVDERIRILHLMAAIGVDAVNIGFPAASAQAQRAAERLGREIVEHPLPLRPTCAARTVAGDIAAVAELAQRIGHACEVATFIGSSRIRQFVEGWTLDEIARTAERAVAFAVSERLPVCLVTEDTTRTDPDALHLIYSAGIRAGATRICIADTVGHATPSGTRALVTWLRAVVRDWDASVAIDWHGHNDRGLATANALAAIESGVDCVHGTALGIGERVGNTPLEPLLLQLVRLGLRTGPLDRLSDYSLAVAHACDHAIPFNHPVLDRTASIDLVCPQPIALPL